MGENKWRLVSKLGYVFKIIVVPDREQPKSEQHYLTDEAMGVGFIAITQCQDFGGSKATQGGTRLTSVARQGCRQRRDGRYTIC